MPKPTTLRIPDATRESIEEIVQRTRRDFSSVANEMLEEAVRMRRIPGIVFADGPTGRRARVAGTGTDVFEVVLAYQGLNADLERLQESYHWLHPNQLRAALAYAESYPNDIDEHLERETRWSSAEAVHQRYPFTRCAST